MWFFFFLGDVLPLLFAFRLLSLSLVVPLSAVWSAEVEFAVARAAV